MGAFRTFTQSYSKKYASEVEYHKRLQTFDNNVKYIAAHNSLSAPYKVSKVFSALACCSAMGPTFSS